MEQANSARASVVVFVGGDEEKQGNVKIRNMKSGEENVVAGSELLPSLAQCLHVV